MASRDSNATDEAWQTSRVRTRLIAVVNRFIETITLVADTAARAGFRVVGGFALSFLGVTRATGDVDFLADAA